MAVTAEMAVVKPNPYKDSSSAHVRSHQARVKVRPTPSATSALPWEPRAPSSCPLRWGLVAEIN